jgi:hypothetical protein
MVNEQDKKKAANALHEDIRGDEPKGSQQGGARAAE